MLTKSFSTLNHKEKTIYSKIAGKNSKVRTLFPASQSTVISTPEDKK